MRRQTFKQSKTIWILNNYFMLNWGRTFDEFPTILKLFRRIWECEDKCVNKVKLNKWYRNKCA